MHSPAVSRLSLIPPSLCGPACVDALGFPRYAATIWLDFLNAHAANATREKYARAISSLYRDAEAMQPPVDLDKALIETNLRDIRAVLSSALLGHQSRQAADKRWALQKRFVFGILDMVNAEQAHELSRQLKELQRSYSQLRNAPAARPTSQTARSLPADVLEDMFELVDPTSCRNPFRTATARWRNYTMVLMLFQLGLRRGEMLLLTPDSIHSEFDFRLGCQVHWLKITQPDLADTRASPPRLKNGWAARDLPLSRTLLSAIDIYTSQYRLSADHGFLFSSSQRLPLSEQSVEEIFQVIKRNLSPSARESLAARAGNQLSPHSLRHTASVVRYQRFSSSGMDHEEMSRRIRPFMGWAPGSEMPFHYARKFFEPRYAKLWDETFDDALAALREGIGS